MEHNKHKSSSVEDLFTAVVFRPVNIPVYGLSPQPGQQVICTLPGDGSLTEEFDRNNATAFQNPDQTNKQLKLFWIGVGKEDGLYLVISDYLKVLDEKKIKHETFINDGGHTWMTCKLFLTTIAQKLFK